MENNRIGPADIRRLLKFRGWKQIELARALDVHKSLITHWLTGFRTPDGPAAILVRQWLNESRQTASAMAKV